MLPYVFDNNGNRFFYDSYLRQPDGSYRLAQALRTGLNGLVKVRLLDGSILNVHPARLEDSTVSTPRDLREPSLKVA